MGCRFAGAAAFDELEWRRVRMLKEAGFNAIRSAHNPANRALLDACDALGVYVMDEGWDKWYKHKSRYDYAGSWRENWKKDLSAMVSYRLRIDLASINGEPVKRCCVPFDRLMLLTHCTGGTLQLGIRPGGLFLSYLAKSFLICRYTVDKFVIIRYYNVIEPLSCTIHSERKVYNE